MLTRCFIAYSLIFSSTHSLANEATPAPASSCSAAVEEPLVYRPFELVHLRFDNNTQKLWATVKSAFPHARAKLEVKGISIIELTTRVHTGLALLTPASAEAGEPAEQILEADLSSVLLRPAFITIGTHYGFYLTGQ